MKQHISIHPITKERYIDVFNIDSFRYYTFVSFFRDFLIGITMLLLFATSTTIRTFMESLPLSELIILSCGFFIITFAIMFIYVFPAVHKKYLNTLAVVVPRHILPILVVYIIATVIPSLIPSLGIFTLDDKLIVGTLQMLRIELMAGVIIFALSFLFAIRNRNKI